jgi:hypothetical protein
MPQSHILDVTIESVHPAVIENLERIATTSSHTTSDLTQQLSEVANAVLAIHKHLMSLEKVLVVLSAKMKLTEKD